MPTEGIFVKLSREKDKLRERTAASKKTPAPVVALRIPEADLALARKREKRKVGWVAADFNL